MTTTERLLPVEAEPYLAAVRSLLWALPAAEREELLDDLSAHLTELAAEEGPPLRERLGVPSAYAAEFVASAGVEPPAQSATSMSRIRSFRLPLGVRERLAALRPAWQVLRPFLLVFGGAELFIDDFTRNVAQFEIVLLGLAAVAGISLSQRLTGAVDRFATIAAVIGALVLLGAWGHGPRIVYVDNTGIGPTGFLMRGDGTPVSNIWAYDTEGNPVDVFLFDQDGQPLVDLAESGWDRRTGEEIRSTMRTDADGRPIRNLFPREQRRLTYDEYGRPYEQPERAPVVSTPRVGDESTTTTTTATTAAPDTSTTTVTTAPAGPPSTP